MADTKTYLKVPYGDSTIRMLPFGANHLTAITMAQHLRSDEAKLGVVLDVLADLMGDDEYARVIRDLVAKTPGLPTVTELLDSIVKATVAYAKAQAEPESDTAEPAGPKVPATFSAGSRE